MKKGFENDLKEMTVTVDPNAPIVMDITERSITIHPRIVINGDEYQGVTLKHCGKEYTFTMDQVVKGLLYLLGDPDE